MALEMGEEVPRPLGQVGRTLRALTVDDGRSVVTGNYLKVRIAEPRPRNIWVDVEINSADPLVGRALTH